MIRKPLCVCPPVIQELLQGFPPDHRYEPMKEAILSLPCLAPNMSLDLYFQAGEIYRSGRRCGFTIRSSTDCLIAAIAMAHNVSVWHKDRDFDAIAGFTELIVVSKLSAK